MTRRDADLPLGFTRLTGLDPSAAATGWPLETRQTLGNFSNAAPSPTGRKASQGREGAHGEK